MAQNCICISSLLTDNASQLGYFIMGRFAEHFIFTVCDVLI